MIVGLASPGVASSIDDGLAKIDQLVASAAAQDAEIVCFPEAYLPGLRGQDFDVPPFDRTDQDRVLAAVSAVARAHGIAIILGMERIVDAGRQIASVVFGRDGELLGLQTKNQLDPTEDRFYVPGHTRQTFEVNGVTFGIATRDGDTPKRFAGPRRAARTSCSTRSSPARTTAVYASRGGEAMTRRTMRRRWCAAASRTASTSRA